jgi:excisionase family DNA binding protein
MTPDPETTPEQPLPPPETLPTDEKLMTYKEIAERLGVAISTVRRWKTHKQIPCVQIGHQYVRFHYPSVLKHLKESNPVE